jgi:hypothetical protein
VIAPPLWEVTNMTTPQSEKSRDIQSAATPMQRADELLRQMTVISPREAKVSCHINEHLR